MSDAMKSEVREINFKLPTKIKLELLEAIILTTERDGISQAEVARRLGSQLTNINSIFRARMIPSVDVLLKIAEAIGLDVTMTVKRLKSKT
jgi:transcriptional regulator with XRE-family HTH domain